jgi:hypothetical protein
MIINIPDKSTFINKFLNPLNKINENAVLKVTGDKISSLTSANDGTLILHTNYMCANDLESTILNIPDINKFIKVLSCTCEDSLDLDFDKNCLVYKSNDIKFKYHLLEDGILSAPSVNVSRIKELNFDISFKVNASTILNLLKGSTFASDTNKIYFYTDGGAVYGKLTDMQKHNVDVYTQKLTDEHRGELPDGLPLNFEVIRMIAGVRFASMDVHINTENNVYIFDITDDNYKLNYIASGYIG